MIGKWRLAQYGKGRAVAVTHHGFFEKEAAQRDENVAFLRECLAWLAGGKAPTVVCLDVRRNAMKDCVARAAACPAPRFVEGRDTPAATQRGSQFFHGTIIAYSAPKCGILMA